MNAIIKLAKVSIMIPIRHAYTFRKNSLFWPKRFHLKMNLGFENLNKNHYSVSELKQSEKTKQTTFPHMKNFVHVILGVESGWFKHELETWHQYKFCLISLT